VTPERDAFGNPVARPSTRPAATSADVDELDAGRKSSLPADGPEPSTRWSRKIAKRESGRRGAEALFLGNPNTYPLSLRLLASAPVRWGFIVLGLALLGSRWHAGGLSIAAFLAASVGFALHGRIRSARRGRRDS
jgi:hypothetical protein